MAEPAYAVIPNESNEEESVVGGNGTGGSAGGLTDLSFRRGDGRGSRGVGPSLTVIPNESTRRNLWWVVMERVVVLEDLQTSPFVEVTEG